MLNHISGLFGLFPNFRRLREEEVPLFPDPHGLGIVLSIPLISTINVCTYAHGGGVGQMCGGKLFDRILGNHHHHNVASFAEMLKPR